MHTHTHKLIMSFTNIKVKCMETKRGKGEWNELRGWDLHIDMVDTMYKIGRLSRWPSQ